MLINSSWTITTIVVWWQWLSSITDWCLRLYLWLKSCLKMKPSSRRSFPSMRIWSKWESFPQSRMTLKWLKISLPFWLAKISNLPVWWWATLTLWAITLHLSKEMPFANCTPKMLILRPLVLMRFSNLLLNHVMASKLMMLRLRWLKGWSENVLQTLKTTKWWRFTVISSWLPTGTLAVLLKLMLRVKKLLLKKFCLNWSVALRLSPLAKIIWALLSSNLQKQFVRAPKTAKLTFARHPKSWTSSMIYTVKAKRTV